MVGGWWLVGRGVDDRATRPHTHQPTHPPTNMDNKYKYKYTYVDTCLGAQGAGRDDGAGGGHGATLPVQGPAAILLMLFGGVCVGWLGG